MAKKVFLSYRRSDTANHAMALKLVLEQYLPDVIVFVDTGSIKPGENWPDRLRDELDSASMLLALIGPKWRFAPDGRDRLSEPDDWVRAEIAHALNRLPEMILPVKFVESDSRPEQEAPRPLRNLPPEIDSFATIQPIVLRATSYVDDAEDIARVIARKLQVKTKANNIEYPRPNKLKSKAPKISQREFEALKHEDETLSGWRFSSVITGGASDEVGTELCKLFEFRNFKRAFSFMNEAALVAEGRPHHPVWTNRWNKVDVSLRTFDAGQNVTWYDVEIASRMNEIAAEVEAADTPIWPYNLKS